MGNGSKKANEDIREAIAKSGRRYWEVAARYGCSAAWFTTLLRMELDNNTRAAILEAINPVEEVAFNG